MLDGIENPRIEAFLEAPGRFAIYGASSVGRSVRAGLGALGLQPEAYVDTHRRGDLEGLAVWGPEQAVAAGLDHVITASMWARDMERLLRQGGFAGPILDLSVAHLARWSGHYDVEALTRAASGIAAARACLADEASRAVLDGVLEHRRSLLPSDLPAATTEYRHSSAPLLPGETLIEGGAFDGETSLDFAQALGPVGRVHAFEPAAENFALLRDALENSAEGERVTPHCAGLWHESGKLAMQTEGQISAQFTVGEDGDEAIEVVSIDDFVREHAIERVDWIKLDVEGAEREALEGARRTLAEHGPKLAVCVYHLGDDLWALPSWIRELGPRYDVRIAHHAQTLYETVCYAVPSG